MSELVTANYACVGICTIWDRLKSSIDAMQSLFGTKMTALFAKANFLETKFQKISAKKNFLTRNLIQRKQTRKLCVAYFGIWCMCCIRIPHIPWQYTFQEVIYFESMKYISHPYLLHFKGGLGGPH